MEKLMERNYTKVSKILAVYGFINLGSVPPFSAELNSLS